MEELIFTTHTFIKHTVVDIADTFSKPLYSKNCLLKKSSMNLLEDYQNLRRDSHGRDSK
ncbi:hypothetical protein [Methanosarcina barkeri]|uniref:hypothetical protein n=1 Tax=Methanosarcina barkeri TaxID=2208 RepID=UPI000ADC0A12|nr:hypothetical protein [Methanosarcina barkeri]